MNYKISAARVPLEGWRACIWVETLRQWFPMRAGPVFASPDSAIEWGRANA